MADITVGRLFASVLFKTDPAAKQRLDRDIASIGKRLDSAGRRLTIGGAGFAAALFGAGRTLVGFEKNINAVEAASGASAENMERLRAQALGLGRSTQFWASQVAGAQKSLALAGQSTDDILKTTPGSVTLAAAGDLDLAKAADLQVSLLAGFGLAADQSQRVADVLARGASSAKTTVADLAASMIKAAPIASSLGIELETVAAASAALQQQGIAPEEAGTGLRNVLLRLLKLPVESKRVMDRVLEGTGMGSGDIQKLAAEGEALRALEILKTAGADVTDFAQIFDTHSASIALGLSKMSGWILDMTGNLRGAEGAGSSMAATMQQGIVGVINQIGSRVEALTLKLGSSGLTAILEGLGRAAIAVLDWLHDLPVGFHVAAAVAGVLGAALLPLGLGLQFLGFALAPIAGVLAAISTAAIGTQVGLGLLTVQAWTSTAAMALAATATKLWAAATWALNAAMLANPIGALIIGVAGLIGLVYLLHKHWDGFTRFLSASLEGSGSAFMAFLKLAGNVWDRLKGSFIDAINWMRGRAEDESVADWLGRGAEGFGQALISGFTDALSFMDDATDTFFEGLFGKVAQFFAWLSPRLDSVLPDWLKAALGFEGFGGPPSADDVAGAAASHAELNTARDSAAAASREALAAHRAALQDVEQAEAAMAAMLDSRLAVAKEYQGLDPGTAEAKTVLSRWTAATEKIAVAETMLQALRKEALGSKAEASAAEARLNRLISDVRASHVNLQRVRSEARALDPALAKATEPAPATTALLQAAAADPGSTTPSPRQAPQLAVPVIPGFTAPLPAAPVRAPAHGPGAGQQPAGPRTVNAPVTIGEIRIDASGSDATEISRNIGESLSDQMQNMIEDTADQFALP